jgi:hypothetical protein
VGALEGDVTAEDGASLEGAHVEAHARTSTGAYYTSHERVWEAPVIEGRYRFDALPVGQFCVVARGGGIRTVVEWIQDGRFPTAPQATVEAGATARLDLTVADGAVIEGVVTAGGAAVRGARVRATRDPRTSNVPDGVNLLGANVRRYDYPGTRPADHPLTHRWATTGADGRYRLDGLEPGPYRIDVFAEGLSHVQRLGVEARVEEPTPLDVTLVPAGVLQGVVPERAYVGVRPVDSRTFAAIAILGPAHVFTFAGLPPGEYEVGSPYWNRETTVFGRARVEAGRTTWIDLRDSGRNAARGRVLAGGRPLPDAVVQFRWRRARTDGTGRFEVRWEDADSVSGAAFEVHRDLPGGGQQTWKVHRDVPPTGESEVGDLVVGEHVLTLRVVDGEGVPLVVWLDVSAGAEGGAVKGSGGGGPIMQARGRTGEDGILRLEGCPANDRYVAKAEADGLPFQTTFSVPAPAPVLVQVPETGALTVEVLDASGDARAEANVAATSWTGAGPAPVDEEAWASARPGEATTVYGTTGQDGRARLPRVVAGTVRVVAWWKTRSTGLAPSTYAHGRVDLGPGEERAVRVRAEDTR